MYSYEVIIIIKIELNFFEHSLSTINNFKKWQDELSRSLKLLNK